MTAGGVAVLGTGRVGLTLARALVHSGTPVRLLGRTERPAPPGVPPIEVEWGPALTETTLVLVAVPDDAIADTAVALAGSRAIGAGHVVLHTSGLHDRSALAALDGSGAALGSLHPLQTFATGSGDTDLLHGIPAVLEGDQRAVTAGRQLAEALGMGPVIELPTSGKAAYHAAAVVASNYLVVLADLAERLARTAGAGDAAATLFQPLMRQTLENIVALGNAKALTGPVRRGDVGTVAAHLAALEGDSRTTYLALAHEALELARRAGLAAEAATEMASLLRRSARG